MNIRPNPIVVVGSINMDFVVTAPRIPVTGETLTGSEFQTHFGGKGANQAMAVARLGYPVEMLGRVGTDVFGPQIRNVLHNAGVGISAVEVVGGSSGVASITVSDSGENAIVVVPGANGQVSPEFVDRHEKTIRNAGLVLAQLEVPMETIVHLAELCRRHQIPLILDPAPAQELPQDVFRSIDWLTPNQTEASVYSGRVISDGDEHAPQLAAASILAKGCRGVVLKMGSRGAYVASRDGVAAFIPAFTVDVVDTTGAGDAFNGGFATALMLGKSPAESAVFAAAVAAISVTRAGAQGSMPSMEEVDCFLENAPMPG
ncbi:MAG: ribokinase [Acidobacteriaceae bacterium]